MDLSGLWSLQCMMFLLVIAGAVLTKKNILKPEGKGMLTDLVLYFLLPCNIINAFRMEFSLSILQKFALCLIVACLIQVLCYFLSRILYNRKPKEIRQVMQYCTMISNSGFLGLPIAEGLFGAEGLMFGSIFIVPTRIMMWTAGMACFTDSDDLKTVVKKLALHPCIVAVYIGLALLFFQAPMAEFYQSILNSSPEAVKAAFTVAVSALDRGVRSAGSCTTPMTMLLIGMMMADVKFTDMFDGNVLFISLLRLVLLPAIVLVGCRLAGLGPLLTGLAVVITGMPAGSTSAILASKYGCDYVFATKCIVVSTLLSMLSVPIWGTILG